MNMLIPGAVLLPFLGTISGAAGVFILSNGIDESWNDRLMGFASGIMTAASVWSLLIPAIEKCAFMGKAAAIPAVVGIWSGFLLLMWIDMFIRSIKKKNSKQRISLQCNDSVKMLMIAVTLHNFPEGMAVGAVAAACIGGIGEISAAEVIILSLGVAIQNVPEGAIISMPMCAAGESRTKAFLYGTYSGIAELIGAILTFIMAELLTATIPWLLSFSAGAMLYVVVEELIPEISDLKENKNGTLFFAAGFSLMMLLDVALG